MADRIIDVPLKDIYYDPDFNVRQSITPASVKSLADDIVSLGRLMYEIILEPYTEVEGYKYRIVCGNRRYMACKLLKWETIPAKIYTDLTEHKRWLCNAKENIERQNLTVWEEALVLEKVYPGGLPGYKTPAKELGWSVTKVKIRYRLLGMHERIQKAVHRGRIGVRELTILQEIPDPDVQLQFFNKTLEDKKKHGRALSLQKRFRPERKKSKAEVNKMLTLLMDASVTGIGPKLLCWTQGWISDEEIVETVKEYGFHLRSLEERIEKLENDRPTIS